jgi:hypothetical protein
VYEPSSSMDLSFRLTSQALEAGNGRNLLVVLDFELDPPDSVVAVVGAPEEDCLPLPFRYSSGFRSRPCGGDSEFEVMGSYTTALASSRDVQVVLGSRFESIVIGLSLDC